MRRSLTPHHTTPHTLRDTHGIQSHAAPSNHPIKYVKVRQAITCTGIRRCKLPTAPTQTGRRHTVVHPSIHSSIHSFTLQAPKKIRTHTHRHSLWVDRMGMGGSIDRMWAGPRSLCVGRPAMSCPSLSAPIPFRLVCSAYLCRSLCLPVTSLPIHPSLHLSIHLSICPRPSSPSGNEEVGVHSLKALLFVPLGRKFGLVLRIYR
mmetsp:Transcript_19579/g.47421  ORF Transcript_19579/g.47421 Transcript_19579/m.47421 type:complete len:204 (-) Transcript_19579:206-817(-)